MKELQERHERVDKRDLQIAKKRESISLKYLLGLIFGTGCTGWAGKRKRLGEFWGEMGTVGNIHRVADYQRLGEYSVWMSLVT